MSAPVTRNIYLFDYLLIRIWKVKKSMKIFPALIVLVTRYRSIHFPSTSLNSIASATMTESFISTEDIVVNTASLSINDLSPRPENGLLIYWHPDCYHHNIDDHPEQPKRVNFILDGLRTKYDEKYFREAAKVTEEQILMFHTPRLLLLLNKIFSFTEQKHKYKMVDGVSITVNIPPLVTYDCRTRQRCGRPEKLLSELQGLLFKLLMTFSRHHRHLVDSKPHFVVLDPQVSMTRTPIVL